MARRPARRTAVPSAWRAARPRLVWLATAPASWLVARPRQAMAHGTRHDGGGPRGLPAVSHVARTVANWDATLSQRLSRGTRPHIGRPGVPDPGSVRVHGAACLRPASAGGAASADIGGGMTPARLQQGRGSRWRRGPAARRVGQGARPPRLVAQRAATAAWLAHGPYGAARRSQPVCRVC